MMAVAGSFEKHQLSRGRLPAVIVLGDQLLAVNDVVRNHYIFLLPGGRAAKQVAHEDENCYDAILAISTIIATVLCYCCGLLSLAIASLRLACC